MKKLMVAGGALAVFACMGAAPTAISVPAGETVKVEAGCQFKGGVLVNTARKEVIDEAQLLEVMAQRTDLKYVTDIMPDAHARFSELEGRYFSTPKKMGAQTAEANINAGIAAANQIVGFLKDGITRFQVNKF